MTKQYMVFASETVRYAVVVEADSEDEAREMVSSGEVELLDPYDYCELRVTNVEDYK